MLGVGESLPEFSIVGVKPKFNAHEEKGVSAFETITNNSFPGKWKVFYFYPKDFTFVCPTEIVEFAKISKDFEDRDCVVLGGGADNEFCKLAWRREHKDLSGLNQWSFADNGGVFASALGILDRKAKVPLRATFIVDPHNVIQHVSVNSLSVGRNPKETLRILDALQTDDLCPCNRPVGGDVIKAA